LSAQNLNATELILEIETVLESAHLGEDPIFSGFFFQFFWFEGWSLVGVGCGVRLGVGV
jgi:hypothetical protein